MTLLSTNDIDIEFSQKTCFSVPPDTGDCEIVRSSFCSDLSILSPISRRQRRQLASAGFHVTVYQARVISSLSRVQFLFPLSILSEFARGIPGI